MLQTFATLGSLLLSGAACGVIVRSLMEERQAIMVALGGGRLGRVSALPPHTQRVAAPRPARIIRLDGRRPARRAAA